MSSAGIPRLLQRVDDDKLCCRVIAQGLGDLFLQSAAQLSADGGKAQAGRCLIGQAIEPTLQAAHGVLQTQVQHVAALRPQSPKRETLGNLQPEPEHEPAFANLAGASQQRHPLRDQALHDEQGLLQRRREQSVSIHNAQLFGDHDTASPCSPSEST